MTTEEVRPSIWDLLKERFELLSKDDFEKLDSRLANIEKLLLQREPTTSQTASVVETESTTPSEKPVIETEAPLSAPKSITEAEAPVPSAKPVKRKTTKNKAKTSTDLFLECLSKHASGADVRTLSEKLSFDKKKVRNLIARLLKLNKIEKIKRGVYKVAK